MNVALTTHWEGFIRQLIDSGRYNNASEVVRAALRKLQAIKVEPANGFDSQSKLRSVFKLSDLAFEPWSDTH